MIDFISLLTKNFYLNIIILKHIDIYLYLNCKKRASKHLTLLEVTNIFDSSTAILFRRHLALLPYIIEHVHNTIVYSECNGYIKHDSAQSRHSTFVEGQRTLGFPCFYETIPRILVFGGF